jgi:hypothetical protein
MEELIQKRVDTIGIDRATAEKVIAFRPRGIGGELGGLL